MATWQRQQLDCSVMAVAAVAVREQRCSSMATVAAAAVQWWHWRWHWWRPWQWGLQNSGNEGALTQNLAGSIGSGRDSGRGSGGCCSAAAMAGRGSGAAEVATMRSAATVTTV